VNTGKGSWWGGVNAGTSVKAVKGSWWGGVNAGTSVKTVKGSWWGGVNTGTSVKTVKGSWWGGVARSHSSPLLQPLVTPLAESMPPWLTNPMSANAPVLSLTHSHFHSLAQAHSLLQSQSLSYSLARGPPCNPPSHLRHHKLMPLPPTDASLRLSTQHSQLDRLDLACDLACDLASDTLSSALPMSSSSGSLPRLRPVHSLGGIRP